MATIEIIHRAATRPTWAEISLVRLQHNFRALQGLLGQDFNICSVVKADAYGHGAAECALALESWGTTWLGVTSLDEAIPLRDEGVRSRILLMTGFWRGEEDEIIRLQLTPTIWEVDQIDLLEAAAARQGMLRHAVHLKVDTGMGRLGVTTDQLTRLCSTLRSSSHLCLEGLSTHLASSEILDTPSIGQQLQRFEAAQQILRDQGFAPSIVHVANTSAVVGHHEAWYNMVRPGLALYGYHLPFEREARNSSIVPAEIALQPVLTWKTRILSLREVPAHQALGYGGTYVTPTPARIAVLPVGYADGLNRHLSSRGRVVVREEYAPIVGRISMDLTLVDVTGIAGVEVGDEVILLGASETKAVDALEHAKLANTIPYEILCNISKRVPRKYLD